MMLRVQELCRKLRPVLGPRIDRLWSVYLAESDPAGKADLEQTLELLAARHLGQNYMPDRSPFPPPDRAFALAGDIQVGNVCYGQRELYPFFLRSHRLKEHILVAGRSGSGKTNHTFVLMQGIMARGIKVLALDWKRGYRDLLALQPDLRLYTIGREISPFRFNPLIPPPGCEPNVWIKLIVDVIASAYLGGEGVISLLVAGLDKLFRDPVPIEHLLRTSVSRLIADQFSQPRGLIAIRVGEAHSSVASPISRARSRATLTSFCSLRSMIASSLLLCACSFSAASSSSASLR